MIELTLYFGSDQEIMIDAIVVDDKVSNYIINVNKEQLERDNEKYIRYTIQFTKPMGLYLFGWLQRDSGSRIFELLSKNNTE